MKYWILILSVLVAHGCGGSGGNDSDSSSGLSLSNAHIGAWQTPCVEGRYVFEYEFSSDIMRNNQYEYNTDSNCQGSYAFQELSKFRYTLGDEVIMPSGVTAQLFLLEVSEYIWVWPLLFSEDILYLGDPYVEGQTGPGQLEDSEIDFEDPLYRAL